MRAFRQSGLGQAIFGLIVLTIILGFLVTGRGLNLASFEEDCAVEVGNHCVEPKEFYAAYGLVASIGLNERVAKQMGLKEVVARGLAERELLLAEAKRLGVATGEESVDTELLEGRTHVSLPADGAERLAASLALCVDGPSGGCEPGTLGLRSLPVKKNGEFDIELYKRMVRVATGRSPSQFKEMQQRELSAARVRELVTASVRVSEEEAFLSYARARSTATARVVTIDSNWFERWVTLPTAADIQSWKTSHEAELKASVERSKAAWKVGCPIVQEIVLEAQGEESQTALLDRGKALARLDEKGFEAAARKSSVVASAHLGGRIGCLDATSNPEAAELLVALQAVDRPGAITAPVTTSRGVTVLRLVDWVKAENVEALASEFHGYELTSAFLGGEAARKFAEDLVAKLGPAADTSAQTEEAVRATLARVAPNEKEHPGLTDPLRPRSDVSRAFTVEQSPVPSALGSESPARLVFDLAQPGDVVKKPIPRSGGYALLQLKEKDLATREKFGEERELVMGQLRARKAEEALSQYVGALVEKAGGVRFNQAHVPHESDDGKKPG